MKKRTWKNRITSLLLATLMVLGVFPVQAFSGDYTTCGIPEHHHDDSCYSSELICGLEESEEHTHADECYAKILTCGLEEHIHSEACYKAEEQGEEPAKEIEATESEQQTEVNAESTETVNNTENQTEETKNTENQTEETEASAETTDTMENQTEETETSAAEYPAEKSKTEESEQPAETAEETENTESLETVELLKTVKSLDTVKAPSADYTFPQEVVYLEDIVDALGISISNNSALSVDTDLIELSATAYKNNSDPITLTATGYFELATLTIQKNKKDIQYITLSWPAPTDSEEEQIELVEYTKEAPLIPETAKKAEIKASIKSVIPDDAIWSNDVLYLTGKMPGNAVVEANPVDIEIDGKTVIAAYDITIYANANQQKKGKAWQPAGDKIQVHIQTDALSGKDSKVDIYHIADGEEPEPVGTVPVIDGTVDFEAASFSVYVIVEHEGNAQAVARRIYHFIDPDYHTNQEAGYESLANDQQSAAPYMFPNKNKDGDYQCTQIILDGESLELIKNPADIVADDNGTPDDTSDDIITHFYGWYTVKVENGDDTSDPLSGGGSIVYKWVDPTAVVFDTAISFTSEEIAAKQDVHIYLAPVYTNYHFANFHEIAKATEDSEKLKAQNNGDTYIPKFISRKMLVLDVNSNATVGVSDVTATPTDNVHYMFRGWEVYIDGVKIGLVSSGAALTTDGSGTVTGGTMLLTDENGAPQTAEGSGDKQYIMTVDSEGEVIYDPLYFVTLVGEHDIDFYPIFNEIRWVYFNVGESGNGASYVPSKLILTDDDSSGLNTIDTNELTLPTRAGYTFDGWYASKSGSITLTDGTFEKDSSDYVLVAAHNGTAFEFTSAFTGIYNAEGTFASHDATVGGFWYQSASGSSGKEQGIHIAKWYNDEKNVSSDAETTVWPSPGAALTLYAHWTKVVTAPYKVVIWKQKVTDAYGIEQKKRTYDYETFYLADDFNTSTILTVAATGSTINSFSGKVKGTGASSTFDLAALGFTGFQYSWTDWPSGGKTIDPDGSTVINLYYDRIGYTLRFFFARRELSGGNETGNFYVSALSGGNFTPPTGTYTWQQAVDVTGTNRLAWNNANTNNFNNVCTYDNSLIGTEDYNGYRYYYYMIKANYGASIGDLWPDYDHFPNLGTNKQVSWFMMRTAGAYGVPGNGDSVKGKVAIMDEQILGNLSEPETGNFLFARYGSGNDWTYHIYFQTIEGVDYSDKTVVERSGISYYLSETVSVRSNSGASGQHAPAYEGFDNDHVEETNSGYNMYYYYPRLSYTFIFDDNYPDNAKVNDVATTGGEHSETVAFDAALSPYGYTTSGTITDWYYGPVNATNTATYQITPPDHYRFGGWYEDSTCRIPFDFSTEKMPASGKKIYAKWIEIQFSITIDANAGTISRLNPSTFVTTSFATASASDLTTEYVKDTGFTGFSTNNIARNYNSDPANNADTYATFEKYYKPSDPDDIIYVYTFTRSDKTRTWYYRPASRINTYDGESYQYSYWNEYYHPYDSEYTRAFSTYANLSYAEPLGQYDLSRNYVPVTDDEAARLITEGKKVYYYMNGLRSTADGTKGNDVAMRNSIFLPVNADYSDDTSEKELNDYFRFFANGVHWDVLYFGDEAYDMFDLMETDSNGDGLPDADPITGKLPRFSYLSQEVFDAWFNSNYSSEFNKWFDSYIEKGADGKPQFYRLKEASEEYQLLNWYIVDSDDPSLIGQIFDFDSAPNARVVIQAEWRLNGRYHLEYAADGVNELGGEAVQAAVTHWRDPDESASGITNDYADNTNTIVREQPRFKVSGDEDDYIFLGWYIAGWKEKTKANPTDPTEYEIDPSVAMEGTTTVNVGGSSVTRPLKFYDVGDDVVIKSLYADPKGVVYVQAYFEKYDASNRRPYITNLTLDANTAQGGMMAASAIDGHTVPWTGVGSASITNSSDDSAEYIKFGDIQSSANVHLYRYATYKTFDEIPGTRYFEHSKNYLLLGFDPQSDPENIVEVDKLTGESTGTPQKYIPNYAADAVIGVTRNGNKTLYAIWEPKVYVTFVNETAHDITVDLTGSMASIVNIVTGEFDRDATTGKIVVPAKTGDNPGSVKVVFPDFTENDTFTAKAVNEHRGYKLSVAGVFNTTDPYGTGSSNIKYSKLSTYTGVLQFDDTGIIVTYTEVEDPVVTFDVNGGTWTEADTNYVTPTDDDSKSFVQSDDDTDLFEIERDVVNAAPRNGDYEPADPTAPANKVFVGWLSEDALTKLVDADDADAFTDLATALANTDWSGGTNVTIDGTQYTNYLAYLKANKWNFANEAPYGEILYAVYSDTVVVRFDNSFNNYQNHSWTDNSSLFSGATGDDTRYHTITIMKGDKVYQPTDPTTTRITNGRFLYWVYDSTDPNTPFTDHRGSAKNPSDIDANNIFDFLSPVNADTTLATSWTAASTLPVTITKSVVDALGDKTREFNFSYTIKTYYYQNSGNNDITEPTYVSASDIRAEFTLTDTDSETITLYYWSDSSGSYYNTSYYFYYQTLEVVEGDYTDLYTLTIDPVNNGTKDANTRKFTVDVFTGKMSYTSGNNNRRSFKHSSGDYYYRISDNAWYEGTGNWDSTVGAPVETASATYVNTRKYVNVTVEKQMEDGSTGTPFSFTASLKDNGKNIDWPVSGTSSDYGSFTVNSGSFKVLSLPVGSEFTVTETGAEQYSTTVQQDSNAAADGKTAQFTVPDVDTTVLFKNALPLVAPTAVNFHYRPFIFMGGLGGTMLLLSMSMDGRKRRKRKARA